MAEDTIYALSTVRGKSGVAVIRISGDRAFEVATLLSGDAPAIGKSTLRELRDPEDGRLLDQGLVLAFAGPKSFTGEDVVEFQVHGSVAGIEAIEECLAKIDGLRAAKAGEFSHRALMNGKLDLVELEGISELISAESQAQHRQAVRALSGDLSSKVEAWRQELLAGRSLLEAAIDFSDEELPDDLPARATAIFKGLADQLEPELKGFAAARRVRTGLEIAIVGHPNVGKSTLLNAMAGRAAALTSSIPGTTRDVIEVGLELGGQVVRVLDTAGLRKTDDTVEALGVAEAERRATEADIRLFLVDDEAELSSLPVMHQAGDLVVLCKADTRRTGQSVAVSGLTGLGLDQVFDELTNRVAQLVAGASGFGHERQRDAISAALERLRSAIARSESDRFDVEIVAEDVRAAEAGLDSLTGRIDVEEILGEIFSQFCIGK